MGEREHCADCRFVDLFVDDEGPKWLCRRYPPRAVDEEFSSWPAVCSDDWCGEWVSKSSERAHE